MPKPKKRLDVIATRAMEWQARWTGGLTYEVSHKNQMIVERFVVDLLAGTCSCRFWGLCGMPCPHDCCAIFEKGDNLEDYCSNFYSPVAYVAIYGKLVSPINGENMWPKVECDTIIPPIFRVKSERPRMMRIREPDENRSQTKLRRTGTSVTCSNYGQYGHNKRHCPNPIVSEPDVAAAANEEDPAGANTVAIAAAAVDPAAAIDIDPTVDNRSGVNIHRSERIRVRGRGRGRAASSQPLPSTPACSQQLPTTPVVAASTQPPPILATSASQAPTTATGAVNYESPIVAPSGSSQQALLLEGPIFQPLPAVASADS
ncbi:hypothetical protein Ahy_B08g093184 [Arachis hypogaea]|uniref:SWIM-type domain-containing protein n=1 Tax=Arachis hypogaea TaxID=3818 RepID=A0A444Y5I0_ARAHY|nr:hypothetical protein Ahy_B08g093184 [Arachis hypogaea]